MQVKQKIFNSNQNPPTNITKHVNFRINGQRVERINEVKYLALAVHEFLVQRTHFTHQKKIIARAIGLLSKIRHHTLKHLLKSIYFSLFKSHLIYGCQIWRQKHSNEFKQIRKLQEKAIRILKFLTNDNSVTKKMK